MMKCDVLIAGGGVPGMVLAALLGRAGLSVAMVDAAPPPPALADVVPDGRTVALMGASIDTLQDAGVWPLLRTHGAPLRRMAVADDSRFPAGGDDMVEQVFDATELGREAFGWNLPLTAVRAALAGVLASLKTVNPVWNDSVAQFSVTGAGVTARTRAGHEYAAKLLAGCDGRGSIVRDRSGIAATRRPYGQQAITCLVSHTRPHNDTSVEFHRPGGPFTIVPMTGNTAAIVWVEKDADADAFMKRSRPAFEQAAEERTRGRIGHVKLLTGPSAWPLEYLRAETLTAPRVALAAEAAHVISPIGAQGLNLSLRDVAVLADIVAEAHGLGLDIGAPSVLRRYERARKGDVASRSFTIDAANRAVANDTSAVRALRRLTLRALSLPGPWRKLVMKKGLAA